MTIASTMVWEVRSAGSVTLNGGGGFKPGASGTDYSQQNAVQYALTAVTTSGVTDTMLTASASTDMVGNTCQITAGTNFTVGIYEILAVVAGVSIQVDKNCATGVGVAGVVKVGGATATITSIGSNVNYVQPGNKIWVKGTYATNSDTVAAVGTASLPVVVEGYNTTRGDGYLGRTNSNGPLILTNMPSITYNAAQRLNTTTPYIVFRYLNIITNNATASVTATGIGTTYDSCSVVNNNNTTAGTCLSVATAGALAINCDLSMPSGVAGSTTLGVTQTFTKAIGCRITNAGGNGVSMAASSSLTNCLIYNCGQNGINLTTTTAQSLINYNTIVGNVGDGINVLTGNTGLAVCIEGNMITDNGGFGINNVINTNAIQIYYTRFRDNTSGNIGNASAYANVSTIGSVTSGSGTSDYVNAAGGDYTLKTTSPAVNASLPYAASMGAYQLPYSAGGGTGAYTFC